METLQTIPPLYRVIIAGGRDFDDYGLLCEHCDRLLAQKEQTHKIVIVSGAARGADTLGERYAHERGYSIEQYPADWEHEGKAAGFIRNRQMADKADALIAFWDGQSRGTAHMIDQARRKPLPYRIVKFRP
nr:DUF2493 domain-containing protein [uncultured Prevotella sp.]